MINSLYISLCTSTGISEIQVTGWSSVGSKDFKYWSYPLKKEVEKALYKLTLIMVQLVNKSFFFLSILNTSFYFSQSDFFKPGTVIPKLLVKRDILLWYISCFYFFFCELLPIISSLSSSYWFIGIVCIVETMVDTLDWLT